MKARECALYYKTSTNEPGRVFTIPFKTDVSGSDLHFYANGFHDLGPNCNGITPMVLITRYIGVVHTERDQYHR
uniref:Uncharacterized protein n=1 Tax=Hyaloperonospora arabidopsidis (strain Emoy2) TaxID=559515 RepID=M4B3X5_HYAAE